MNFHRPAGLDFLRNTRERFDIAIVGGGATGLGSAVDAAARGYRTVLIEQADFAKGTSSRSTKLVHGGVRYLKQGRIPLVLEALRERGLLCANAPHLVRDMAFVIPSYTWWEGPFYGIGMKAYDALAGKLGLSPSRMLSKEETLRRIPTVEPEHLVGGVEYHDGQFDDARLALSLAKTAASHGATVLNYVRCAGLLKEHGQIAGLEAEDLETGARFEIRARAVINATGVFVDEIRQLDDAGNQPLLALSQGIHLVLPKEFLPGDAALMIPRTADGRVFFAVPWHDRVVVGTTDTPVREHSLEPRALDEEKDFVMTHAARYLSRDPQPAEVCSVFAGLRPLVKAGGARNTAALSRDHTIVIAESGLITITGGKWTTYRGMAQEVVDRATLVAGLALRPCPTRRLSIHGSTAEQINEPHLQGYGADAHSIRSLALQDSVLAERIHPDYPQQLAEVVWHLREEMARTVEDILARRTRLLLLGARASIEAAPRVAALAAKELGRTGEWAARQVTEYTALAEGYVFRR